LNKKILEKSIYWIDMRGKFSAIKLIELQLKCVCLPEITAFTKI
jgi:hypothetical protein